MRVTSRFVETAAKTTATVSAFRVSARFIEVGVSRTVMAATGGKSTGSIRMST